MCGITGFIQGRGVDGDELQRRCRTMADTITHRGPDGEGVWVDPLAIAGCQSSTCPRPVPSRW